MTEAEARADLQAKVASGSDPMLSVAEVDRLLALARRADANGVEITNPDWVPTYDLNTAAAEGWRWKAGKVAGAYTFTTDGQTFQRAQLYAHCLKQAELYSRRAVSGYPIRTINAVV